MGKFTGVWGTFEFLDETTETIEQVRNNGVQPTVISPCPRHEIDHALGNPEQYFPGLHCFLEHWAALLVTVCLPGLLLTGYCL